MYKFEGALICKNALCHYVGGKAAAVSIVGVIKTIMVNNWCTYGCTMLVQYRPKILHSNAFIGCCFNYPAVVFFPIQP